MTQERQPKTIIREERFVKRAGVGVGAAVAVALAFYAGGALANRDNAKNIGLNPTATPSSSEAGASPSGSPEASVLPKVEVQNFTVEKLGTFAVLPGDIISGDVSMSDTKGSAIFPLYDQDTHKAADVKDNTKTALYTDVQVPGIVHAEWGATVTRGLTAEKKAEMLKLKAISKKRAGFEKTDVVLWTGYNTTTDEAGFRADGTTGSTTSVNPTESPTPGSSLDGLDNQAKIKVILNLFAEGKVDPNSQEGKLLMDIIINCLCRCSNPTETPKPSPKPEVCTPMNDHFMKAGEIFTTASGQKFIVQGDVKIDGITYFDSLAGTGAIDVVSDGKTHTIEAPYGADVQVFNACATDQKIKDTYNNDLTQLNATGRTLDTTSIKN